MLFEKLIVSHSSSPPPSMKPEMSLRYSWEPTFVPDAEPYNSGLHSPTPFLTSTTCLSIKPPTNACMSEITPSLETFQSNYMHCIYLPCILHAVPISCLSVTRFAEYYEVWSHLQRNIRSSDVTLYPYDPNTRISILTVPVSILPVMPETCPHSYK
jgi:hypothetical protein